MFKNVIDTDGFSVSLHYAAPHLVGVTKFKAGGFRVLKQSQRRQRQAEKALGATYVTALPAEDRRRILQRAQARALLSADPGKGNLLTVTDGEKVLRYSGAQRRHDSGQSAQRKQLEELLDGFAPSGDDTYRELAESIGDVQRRQRGQAAGAGISEQAPSGPSSRSCTTYTFHTYLSNRQRVLPRLSKLYRRTLLRRHRYQVYVGRRSADDRFAALVLKTFGEVEALLYGDWGCNPNLKHQPPSPGVGLRRRLCSHFRVLLVHEAYTSSRCARCGSSGLKHPRKDANGKEVHHLLRCSNTQCSCHWWNRDVLGALNIRKTGLHALRTGRWSPEFVLSA